MAIAKHISSQKITKCQETINLPPNSRSDIVQDLWIETLE